jgi:hypothetical protein
MTRDFIGAHVEVMLEQIARASPSSVAWPRTRAPIP